MKKILKKTLVQDYQGNDKCIMNEIKYNYLFWTVLSFIYAKLQKPTSFTLGHLQYYCFTKKRSSIEK